MATVVASISRAVGRYSRLLASVRSGRPRAAVKRAGMVRDARPMAAVCVPVPAEVMSMGVPAAVLARWNVLSAAARADFVRK